MLYGIYILFLAVLGLCCFSRLFSSCSGSAGWSPAARRPLGAEVSLRQTAKGSKAPRPSAQLQSEAQELWCMGLAALGFVESSQTRDGTPVSCIDR